MTDFLARLVFENSEWMTEFESCWWSGFCIVNPDDGEIYLSRAGEKYLESIA